MNNTLESAPAGNGYGRLRYLVNSNFRFYRTSLPRLLPSLRACGIDPAHIHIVVGGAPEAGMELLDGIACHHVTYDSIDFTGLITILKNGLDADYWFYLHDTTVAGRRFRAKLESRLDALCRAGQPDTVGLRRHASMNIGAYRHRYLLDNSDRVLELVNHDLNDAALQRWKAWGVEHEDHMLLPLVHTFTRIRGRDFMVVEDGDYYGTGSRRRVEYYPCLDLYKIKANWEPKPCYGLQL